MVNKKIVIICSIITFIIVALIVAIQIKEFNEKEYGKTETIVVNNQNTTSNETLQQTEETPTNTIEENKIGENQTKIEDTTNTNIETTQNQVQGKEETNIEEPKENNNDKALNLVKEEWGEDDTVYYTIDNQTNNIYNISVRSKSTTAALAEYEVDINKNTVVLK